MVKKQTVKKGIVKKILKTVSYDTGVILRRAKKIGKITKGEPWEKMISGTQGLCHTVGDKTKDILGKMNKSVKKNVGELKESFADGMGSVEAPCCEDKKVIKAVPKGKVKTISKKAKHKVKARKEAPKDPMMEKEIEEITKDLGDV